VVLQLFAAGVATLNIMLKIASYNIHKCVGTDGAFAPERIIAVLKEISADIVALQEADMRFGDRRGLLNLDHVFEHTGLVPVQLLQAGVNHGWHGNVVLLRKNIHAKAHHIDLPGIEPRGAMVVDLHVLGNDIRLIATHFGLLRRSRAQQVAHVLEKAREPLVDCVLLMGDLNEWRRKHRSALTGLEPIFGPMAQFVPSFPSRFPMLALDRILCSPHKLLSDIQIHDSDIAKLASDHLPIKAKLILPKNVKAQ
jgi:endonuclease/exonuclease/phosphatase family metal-dependent hydrolase